MKHEERQLVVATSTCIFTRVGFVLIHFFFTIIFLVLSPPLGFFVILFDFSSFFCDVESELGFLSASPLVPFLTIPFFPSITFVFTESSAVGSEF